MMKDINLDSTDSAKIYRNYIDNSSIQAYRTIIRHQKAALCVLWSKHVKEYETILESKFHPLIPFVKYDKGESISIDEIQKDYPDASKSWSFLEESKTILKNYSKMSEKESEPILELMKKLKLDLDDTKDIKIVSDIESDEEAMLSDSDSDEEGLKGYLYKPENELSGGKPSNISFVI